MESISHPGPLRVSEVGVFFDTFRSGRHSWARSAGLSHLHSCKIQTRAKNAPRNVELSLTQRLNRL